MKLERPLIIFDLETTGIDTSKDRIVQMCFMKLDVTGSGMPSDTLINPGIPIPKGASDVHGITDEMVKNAPTFKEKAAGLLKYIKGCDILGFNSNRFDIVLLYNEFLRAGLTWDYKDVKFIDAHTIYVRKEERTLSAAVKHYLGKNHEDAHSAKADVLATLSVFKKQLEMYEDVPKDLEGLNLYCNFDKPRLDLGGKLTTDENGDVIYNFGKNKGVKVHSDWSYAMWILKSDFPPDVKDIISKIINK